jgi:hypothetical protein
MPTPSEKPVTINGTVFIATEGGESVKLGLVDVLLYRPEIVSQTFASNAASVEDARESLAATTKAKLQAQIDNCNSQLMGQIDGIGNEAKEQLNRLNSDPSLDTVKATLDESAATTHSHEQETQAIWSVIARSKKEMESLDSRSPDEWAKLFPRETLGLYFKDLPPEIARGTTDADGRFSIVAPSAGNFILCAQASRTLGTVNEYYFWAVPVSISNEAPTEIMLTNRNQLTETGVLLVSPTSTLQATPSNSLNDSSTTPTPR